MKFLRGLLSRKDDQLRRKAERLVSSARVNATSLFAPTIDQHALLRNVKTEQWDFVVTIAGVFIANNPPLEFENWGPTGTRAYGYYYA
jgi:hypothetical protein